MQIDLSYAKVRLVSGALPVALVAAAMIVGFKFASSPMVVPLWSPLLGSQVALFGSVWLLFCFGLWIVARLIGFRFPALLVAAALLLVALSAGISAFAVVAAFVIDAFLIGAAVAWRDPGEMPAGLLVATGLAVMALLSGAAELFTVSTRTSFAAATASIPLLMLGARVRACVMAWLRWNVAALRSTSPPGGSGLANMVFAAMIGILGLHLLFVLQPERYYDAMALHLYVPSYVMGHGRWSFDVNAWAFAHMPMTIDFLYTWAYALGGEDAVRLYNFASLVLIAGMIVSWLSTMTSNMSPFVAALMFLSTPLAFIETASLFIENTLTVWITAAAMLASTRWRSMDLAVCRIIVVLMSAAVASKLHGVLALALIGSVMVVGFVRTRPDPRQWLGFVGMAVLGGGFAIIPYVYSWIDTGNPVFPLFNQIFKSSYWPPLAFIDTRWTGHFSWTILWDATFHSSGFIEGYDGVLGLSLLVFLPLACVVALIRRTAVDILPLFFGLGLVLLVASQIQYLRYFYIALPILFVVIGRMIGLGGSFQIARGVTLGVAALTIAAGLFLAPSSAWILPMSDFRADFDPEARRQLVQAQVPERLANDVINDIAGRDARVYYTGSPYPALLEGTGLSSVWYNTQYAAALQSVTKPDEIGALLQKMNIGYVVWTAGAPTPLLNATAGFLKQKGRLLTAIGTLQIYEIKPADR